jgi:hypothetical protein
MIILFIDFFSGGKNSHLRLPYLRRMKNLNALISIIAVLAWVSCDSQKSESDSSAISSSESLLQNLPDPAADYRAAPLWDWNDVITKEEIEFQMKKFKEGGIGGVFIHPRPGLVTEYLSEEWNQLFKYTVDVAKKLEMRVWIYDENSYPSGFAGGHVQARFPDSYTHGTGLGYKITDNLADTVGLEIETIITGARRDAPTGTKTDSTYYIFYRTHPTKSYWYGGFPYVDLLYPGVTDTFMRATMEGYEKYNREDFGTTLMGVFTDEPNLEAAKGPGTVIRWTPDLFDQFDKRWGYDLKPLLPSLVEETGNWMMVRHNYYTLMLELFLDRWAVPWFDYCEKNNLDWTGHYWEHGWPYPGDGIDEAAFYMYHQVPGVDMLGRAYDPAGMEGQFGNTRAIRELGSAANQSGWNRRLSETWGGAGWQISFAELKRLVDWEVVLGVNFVNPHLSYFSMQGVRKFDYPPSFSYQEPWWDNFSLLGDYIGRICLAMSAGEQINNLLVLQPNTTAWMYHSATKDHPDILELSRTFKSFIQELEAAQFEYDLGSEQVLKRFGKADKEGLTIRNRVYDHVVIPPGMRNIEPSTLELLREYLSNGLTVLCLSDSVDYIGGKPDNGLKKLASKYPINWISGKYPESGHVETYFARPDFTMQQVDTAKGQIFHQRRLLDDGQILFLVNSDLSEPAQARCEMKGRNLIEIDLQTGLPVPADFDKNSGKVSFSATIPPGGSRLFLATVGTDKSVLSMDKSVRTDLSVPTTGEIQVKRMSPNVLTIDYLDLETRNQKLKDTYFMTAMYALFKESGLPTGNPWQHKIQFKKQYLEMDNFKEDSWFRVKYRFTVSGGLTAEQLAGIEAVIERPGIWKVFLNGTEIQPKADLWWLDRHFPVFPIGSLVKPGENLIELRAPKMSVFAEIMPVYILGDFNVENASKGFILTPPTKPGFHSWKHTGLPFYGQTVSYSNEYQVEEPAGKFRLILGPWQGAVAEVWVNGQKAGSIGWDPYDLDITRLITKGKNNIEVRVTGSLKNTLGYHHVVQRGWIDSPFSWNKGPEKQPAGEAYEFLDYGMYKEFMVINSR